MNLLIVILFLSLLIYLLVLSWLTLGFLRTEIPRTGSDQQEALSIIICARNEEKTIVRCLHSILDQDYDRNKIQLILINDASGDATVTLAERILKNSGLDYRIISNPQQKGKKQSITYAMQFVSHELVLLRDADTYTRSGKWLQTVSSFRQQTHSDFIIGPVALSDNFGLLWAIQAIENNVLAVMSCGSAYYRKPFLCSGANLIFTRSLFDEVGGYQSHIMVPSGDDIFFLEDVKKLKNTNIRYLKSSDALVYTYPIRSLAGMLFQKIRWASKFRYNSNLLNFSLAFISFLVNAGWVMAFARVFSAPANSGASLCFLLIKLSFDILLLFLASRFIRNRLLLGFALPTALVYPIYACLVALGSVFVKTKWKV